MSSAVVGGGALLDDRLPDLIVSLRLGRLQGEGRVSQ
jgi:hypothetical protein